LKRNGGTACFGTTIIRLESAKLRYLSYPELNFG